MALNIFEELDLTSTGDNVDEGFLKCKNNWEDMDTELHAARGGEADLDTRLDGFDTNVTEVTNARDGEANLLAKIDAMDTLIASNTVDTRDLNGEKLILDADQDTSITADTDDQIDIECSGEDQVTIVDGTITIPDSVLVWNSVTKTIAVSSPSASANVDITGLTAGGLYRVSYRLSFSTTEQLLVTFNGDTGNNYSDTITIIGENATAALDTVSNAGDRANIRLHSPGSGTGEADYQVGSLTFSSVPGDDTVALLNFQNMGYINSSNFYSSTGGGAYDGAAAVTRITITPDNGTITGTVITERIG